MNMGNVKILCKTCKSQTNHEVVTQASRTFDDDLGFWAESTWQVLECLGCGRFTVREICLNSEVHGLRDEPIPSITLYPPRNESTIALDFKWLMELPLNLQSIVSETIKSYDEDMRILCAAGVRATIEGICADKGVSNGPVQKDGKSSRKNNLEGKIEGLAEKGFLTREQANALHQLRFLGNDALHDLPALERGELQLAMEIVKHVINNFYFLTDGALTDKASQLEHKRLSRSKRPLDNITSEQEEIVP